MKTLYCFTLGLAAGFLLNFPLSAQPPKREFRAAWIATVLNLDWPSTSGLHPDVQREQLVSILDDLSDVGIQAVVFQIRTECDALYDSPYDPWSYWLTGTQGVAPAPYYDPLVFAVGEAHKRGMELHAWFNPYRARRQQDAYSPAATHVTVAHPTWIITCPDNFKLLNPGLPEVRDYVTQVIADVVTRYDIDGVHFDDYFYPYPEHNFTNQDDSAYAIYNKGLSRADWRRDNVNLLVKQVHDTIAAIKPHVKFGISPFGIWKNSAAGTAGLEAYYTIYCDAVAWLQAETIDYITPQIYWNIGYAIADYAKLLPWWASVTNGRHLYPGQAAYRISGWSASEMPSQIRLNRSTPNVQGSVFFRAQAGVNDNPRGFADSLRTDLYKYPALLPTMAWKDTVKPNPPGSLAYGRVTASSPASLHWDLPAVAPDGDTASRYAVYSFDHLPALPGELDDARNLSMIAGGRNAVPKTPSFVGDVYYAVTSLDRNYNESQPSEVYVVSAPGAPVLAGPLSGTGDQPPSTTLTWYLGSDVAAYRVQVGTDSTFSTGILVNDGAVIDSFRVVAGMVGQQKYHWRVRGSNAGGTGPFSAVWNFVTGFPATPLLAMPANYTVRAATNMYFRWHPVPGAASYRFQLAETFDFAVTVVDSTSLVDTAFTVNGLTTSKIYFWRVQALNAIGPSVWSDIWRFRTDSVATFVAEGQALPSQFELSQNYPNPFNPTTTIAFRIPMAARVSLRVYNVLGEEVQVLVNEAVSAGEHTALFDASGLPSGVYFYRLIVGGYVDTKKMQYVK